MSWDISLHMYKPACETCGRGEERERVYDVNYTSNMKPMIRHVGFDWDEIEGKRAGDVAGRLSQVVAQLLSARAECESLNPLNGWGNYSSFVGWLNGITQACVDYPDAIIHVSR